MLLAAACRRQHDEAPCSAVASHTLVVAQDAMKASGADEALRQRVAMQLPALRDALDESCTKGNWSAQVRGCMLLAIDGVALAGCQRGLTFEQRAALDRSSGAGTSTAGRQP
jgi:hypothetical protein